MSGAWRIEEQYTNVPGRFAGGTLRDWHVIINPHGGRSGFAKDQRSAEQMLTQAQKEWYCECVDCHKVLHRAQQTPKEG